MSSRCDLTYGGERKINNSLDAMFKEVSLASGKTSASLEQIHLPRTQSRRYFAPQSQQQLIDSVRHPGILQPLLVRPLETGGYELVAGERRYRAAVEIGLMEVPIVERELDDVEAFQLALIENLQRENLNPVEETEGIVQLLALELNLSVKDVSPLLHRLKHEADRSVKLDRHNVMPNQELERVQSLFERLGLMTWESFVKNRLPLLNLPEDILEVLHSGQIAYTKAKALAQIKAQDTRKSVLQMAIAQDWSLSQIKDHIKTLRSEPETIPLKQQLENTYLKAKKVKVWEDPDRQERLRTLLAELETLLS